MAKYRSIHKCNCGILCVFMIPIWHDFFGKSYLEGNT